MGNRWSLLHDKINHFRTSLENPVTSQLFRHYVSTKGDKLENNILFWQEAAKYKVIAHVLLIPVPYVMIIIIIIIIEVYVDSFHSQYVQYMLDISVA